MDPNRDFLRQHGQRGKKIFDYEWFNVKRILRPSRAKRFVPVKATDKDFYSKLYSVDHLADDGFLQLMGMNEPPRASPVADSDKHVKAEYIRHVFKEESYYSVPRVKVEASGEEVVDDEDIMYFQLGSIEYGSNRAKLVPTHKDRLASERSPTDTWLQVYHLDVWAKRDNSNVTCYFDAETEWLNAMSMVNFNILQPHLMTWEAQVSDTDSCVDLVGRKPAAPQVSLLDGSCPTHTILEAMRSREWEPSHGLVIHDSLPVTRFDSRTPHSRKAYFQSLLKLDFIFFYFFYL